MRAGVAYIDRVPPPCRWPRTRAAFAFGLMRFHVLTLFPEAFGQPLLVFSIVGRAVQRGQVSIEVTDIRDYTHDAHGTADDYQFGGGHGMVMKPEPVFEAARPRCRVTATRNAPTFR